ncbi:hypothetical protein G5T42_17150 [Microbacterium sp. 4R-513]|uniref:hypothetical protein n=1 Tax=Microbacterium sp. 4R-513 TaxID=2567934 RepID=UPI0013E1AF66|nr:hypothetical protein [Microbacterium sp. 4R-513]QIG40986.1 hypothetical protein G5T42_17150 [Microbacterium sp. 4R-513]
MDYLVVYLIGALIGLGLLWLVIYSSVLAALREAQKPRTSSTNPQTSQPAPRAWWDKSS